MEAGRVVVQGCTVNGPEDGIVNPLGVSLPGSFDTVPLPIIRAGVGTALVAYLFRVRAMTSVQGEPAQVGFGVHPPPHRLRLGTTNARLALTLKIIGPQKAHAFCGSELICLVSRYFARHILQLILNA